MPNWKSVLKVDPMEWLLSEGQPWLVYHTLVDILDKEETDPDMEAARATIAKVDSIEKIFAEQSPEGGWESDTHCYSCSSQHQGDTMGLLSVLADFGLTVEDERVARACESALRIQTDDGDFRVAI
jgi:hypothetical protein